MHVTRDQFTEAIRIAIIKADLPVWEAVALGRVGRTATHTMIGSYAKCPLGLAGLCDPHTGADLGGATGTTAFADAFDDALGDVIDANARRESWDSLVVAMGGEPIRIA